MTNRVIVLLVVALAGSPSSAKATIQCLGDAGTRQYMCIDDDNVRVNGNVRASRIYTGELDQLQQTAYWFVVDCNNNVHTLQDNDGANLEIFDLATATWRLLAIWLCEVDRPS